MPTYNLIRGVRIGSETFTHREPVTEEEEVKLDVELDESAELEEHIIQCDISEMKALYCGVDQLGLLRINSNSAEPIALNPELPLIWSDGSGEDNPLGVADLTSIFITNSSSSGAMILHFRALLNSEA